MIGLKDRHTFVNLVSIQADIIFKDKEKSWRLLLALKEPELVICKKTYIIHNVSLDITVGLLLGLVLICLFVLIFVNPILCFVCLLALL